MSTEKHRKNEEEILSDFLGNLIIMNLNTYYESVDEYTDKCLSSYEMPDFYLRSKKEGLPDLAIEIKTLQRDYDRPTDNETESETKKYCLSIKDFHVILKLNLVNWVSISPKAVKRYWNELEKELSKYKRKWEDILDRINDIEKILENEDQEKCIKDLSNQKKEELKIIIDYIKSQDEKFLEEPADLIYLDLDIHAETSTKKIKDVKAYIQDNKEEWIKKRIKSFLEDYFFEMKKQGKLNKSAIVQVEDENKGDCLVFTVRFIITWTSEDVNFHVEKIEEFIEESKKKFENLRRKKIDKLDKNPHLELLLIKVTSFMTVTFDDHVKELYEKLVQRGYNYPFYLFKNPYDPLILSKFYLICMNS